MVQEIRREWSLPLFVYEANASPLERELHFHYQIENSRDGWRMVRGQLHLGADGRIQSPVWLEAGSIQMGTGPPLSLQLATIMVPVASENLPGDFMPTLEKGIQDVLGTQWRQKILSTIPSGSALVMEPLLSHRQTRELFLARLRNSDTLRRLLEERRWSSMGGRVSLENDVYAFPFVVSGNFRVSLLSGRLQPDTDEGRKRYFRGLKRRKAKGLSAIVLAADETGRPMAFFSKGMLLVKPGTSFKGKGELLEKLFLRGAELSLQLQALHLEQESWPPALVSAGAEEVREFKSVEKFDQAYHRSILDTPALRVVVRELWEKASPVFVVPARFRETPAPAVKQKVSIYIHANPENGDSTHAAAAVAGLIQKETLEEVEFSVKPYPADGQLDLGVPTVVLRQQGIPFRDPPHAVPILSFNTAQDLRQFTPHLLYWLAVHGAASPVVAVPFMDGTGTDKFAVFV